MSAGQPHPAIVNKIVCTVLITCFAIDELIIYNTRTAEKLTEKAYLLRAVYSHLVVYVACKRDCYYTER